MIGTAVSELPWVELSILLAAAGYVTREALDLLGVSRSSKTLRQENEDLTRRDVERENTIRHLTGEVARLEAEVITLRTQVAELTKRDQSAVLEKLSEHERMASSRTERVIDLLTQIRDGARAGGV